MSQVFETTNFIVEAPNSPHNDREDGGHIKISPKREMESRVDMTPSEAIEFIRLSMCLGYAYKKAMVVRGVSVERINYQENGNYLPKFHLHLYGRAKNAKYHPYGLSFAVNLQNKEEWSHFKPLDAEDILEIKKSMLLQKKKKNLYYRIGKRYNYGLFT